MTSAAGNAQAREITRYSLVASEDEVLLPPGCRFKVESVLPQGDLTIIQLKELPSAEWILDLSPKGLGAVPAGAAPLPTGGAAAEPEPEPEPVGVPSPPTPLFPISWRIFSAEIFRR